VYDSVAAGQALRVTTRDGADFASLWTANISVPHPPGRAGVWQVTAVLTAPFLQGGSLGCGRRLPPLCVRAALTAAVGCW
jgi:hypothetical protein